MPLLLEGETPAATRPSEVQRELRRNHLGERHGPGLPAQRSGDRRLGSDEADLLLDVEPLAQEVDVADPEPEHLALAQAATRTDDAYGYAALRKSVARLLRW
jgi:hypothetical protein